MVWYFLSILKGVKTTIKKRKWKKCGAKKNTVKMNINQIYFRKISSLKFNIRDGHNSTEQMIQNYEMSVWIG